jgi:hypothetical protein
MIAAFADALGRQMRKFAFEGIDFVEAVIFAKVRVGIDQHDGSPVMRMVFC